MDITATIAKLTGVSVFAILEERAENVLDMYEYIIEKANESEKQQKPAIYTDFWDF